MTKFRQFQKGFQQNKNEVSLSSAKRDLSSELSVSEEEETYFLALCLIEFFPLPLNKIKRKTWKIKNSISIQPIIQKPSLSE